ncbi:MAG TPA: PrsW family intramembrane metalloprotease [Roseiflexaceae bacterium]|nr:PrsW family intramembrane metalloprotease [Roseiflexaceae bacterium]
MTLLTAIIAAAIPTAVYSLLLWWLDRYEKEPLSLIFAAFWWGAIPALALALLVELFVLVPLEPRLLGPEVSNWSVVPLIEELLKGLAVVGLYTWARREIDGPLDGIVYGALVGFGFSMTENALYFLHYDNVTTLFWLRSILFGMNHAFFTSMVGLAFGLVRHQRDPVLKGLVLACGFLLAVLFHAMHNYFVSEATTVGVVASWLVQFVGILVVLLVAVLAWRGERAVMERELLDEVADGVLSIDDYQEITSSMRRLQHQSHAMLVGGWACFWKVRRLHHLTTELAFCKSRVRMADRYQRCDETDDLRREIIALRHALKGQRMAWG